MSHSHASDGAFCRGCIEVVWHFRGDFTRPDKRVASHNKVRRHQQRIRIFHYYFVMLLLVVDQKKLFNFFFFIHSIVFILSRVNSRVKTCDIVWFCVYDKIYCIIIFYYNYWVLFLSVFFVFMRTHWEWVIGYFN